MPQVMAQAQSAFIPLANIGGRQEFIVANGAYTTTTDTSVIATCRTIHISSNSTFVVPTTWTWQNGTQTMLALHRARKQQLIPPLMVDPSLPTDHVVIRGLDFDWDSTTSATASGFSLDAGQVVVITDGSGVTITGWTQEAADAFAKAYRLSAHRTRLRSNTQIVTRKRKALNDLPKPLEGELKARETLRDVLTEQEWRRYVTNGFIMARGQSGRWYQIFASGENLKVYEGGKYHSSICIHTDNVCPPSDHVLNMKVMVEVDEDSVLKGGRVYQQIAS